MKKKNKLLLSLLMGLSLMAVSPMLKIYNQRQRQIKRHQRKIERRRRNIRRNRKKERIQYQNKEKHAEFKNSLVALNSFASSVESSVVANAKAFSSASASTSTAMSYSAQQEASQVASASLQQSLIDSEDEDISQQLSQSASTSAVASLNSSSMSLSENVSLSPIFIKEVTHDLSNHSENNPLAKSNNWDFEDFGNLYRDERQVVENYLQSKLPQNSLASIKNRYANNMNSSSYNYALDTMYSLVATSDANHSTNYFSKIDKPLTRLGSLYEHKSNLANHYIMHQLSGSDLTQFESLSNATNASQENNKHDKIIDSYLNSLEDSKAQSIVNQISQSSANDTASYSPNYFYQRGLSIIKDGLKNNEIEPNASGYQGIINALNRSRSDDANDIVANSDDNQFLSSLSSLAESNHHVPISSFSSTFNSKMNSASTSYQELLKSYYLSEQKMLNSLKSSSASSNSK